MAGWLAGGEEDGGLKTRQQEEERAGLSLTVVYLASRERLWTMRILRMLYYHFRDILKKVEDFVCSYTICW
ncbi:hypothetical protein Nepgr_002294 [Nepenthes gracilis]|uniref:Uncharacterized protein n=1 Tax=Nepenthes gracilis TaxID=150966 RepID=A0AAD3RYC9_NEPGR|nr:hypothetical protein Nepgr_002294 [Nepenthes gracilis]